jgi:hypothetical protein
MKADFSDFAGTAEDINALPDRLRDFIHHLEANVDPAGVFQENFILRENVHGLSQWVADLQSGMYVNCVYCGHRYGPDSDTPVAMADILKEHIAECPKHPLSIMVKRNLYLVKLIHRMDWMVKQLNYTPKDGDTSIIQLDAPWPEQKECNRASGEGPCAVCRQPLKDHLMVMPERCPSMVEDCEGKWWKL